MSNAATNFDPEPTPLVIPPPPPSHPMRLRRLLPLLRSLNAEPEETSRVFQVFDAVGGNGGEHLFQRFIAQEAGQDLLRRAPDLIALLSDRKALAAMSDASFGRAYLEFAEANGFAADGLVEQNRNAERETQIEDDPYRAWFWDRYTLAHDLWHVLTGCDTSVDGEAVLLAFSQGHTPQRGFAAVLAMIAITANIDFGFQRSLIRAWRSGRRVDDLLVAPWERLLERPLDEVRRELGIEPLTC